MATNRSWQDIDELFDLALDQPPESRAAWLDQNCGDDPELHARVRELLLLAEEEEANDARRREQTPGAVQGDPLAPAGGLRGPIFEEVAERLLDEKTRGLAAVDDVTLRSGDTVGSYTILGLLGEGGMGRVYRAEDRQLGREVAVKSLSPLLSLSAEGLRRFQREARLLATLNHPNIATIYELVEEAGHSYLVLELVEGETLAERLKRGRLSLEQTVDIARQLAAALREAHDKGVIHRDLKPGNVKLTPEGRTKVLDFGLAKIDPASGTSMVAPQGEPSTNAGIVLGTVAYMSPEQASAKAVDRRTDIWAFGCLLYEMLTGRRAFDGETGPDALAAVLRDDIDWLALPDDTPDVLRDLIESCLAKDPEHRLAEIADVLPLLDLPETRKSDPRVSSVRVVDRKVSRLPWAIAAAAIMVAIAALWAPWRDPPAAAPQGPPIRLSLDPGDDVFFPDDYSSAFALSPDGSRLVFVGVERGADRLYLRPLDELTARPIAGTEGARQPFFSPDGSRLGFFAERKLVIVDLSDEASGSDSVSRARVTLSEIGGNPRGASWGNDDSIVLAPSQTSPLLRITNVSLGASEAELVPLTELASEAGERSHRWPSHTPDGHWVLLTVQDEGRNFDQARIEAASVVTGDRHVIAEDGAHPRWLGERHAIFTRAGRLLAVEVDPQSLRPVGKPDVVLQGVQYDSRNGGTQMAVGGPHLVYVPGPTDGGRSRLSWIDRAGNLRRVLDETRYYHQPRLGPGSEIAILVGDARESELWLVDADHNPTVLATGRELANPVWRPAGPSLTLAERAENEWRLVTFDLHSGAERELLRSPHRLIPADWSPDGRTLVFQERHPETGWDLHQLEVSTAGEPIGDRRQLLVTPFNEANPKISHDGRWLAYESDELDAVVDIYVVPWGRPGVKHRASDTGARLPTWGRDGELLFWETGENRLTMVPYAEEAGGFSTGPPVSAWERDAARVDSLLLPANPRGYDVRREDGRILALEDVTPRTPPGARKAVVVLDWLRAVAPALSTEARASAGQATRRQ